MEEGINLDKDGSVTIRSPPRKRGRMEVPGKCKGAGWESEAHQNTGLIEKAKSQTGKTTPRVTGQSRRGRSLTPLNLKTTTRTLLLQEQSKSHSPTSPLALRPFFGQDLGEQVLSQDSSDAPGSSLFHGSSRRQGEGSIDRGQGQRGRVESEEYFGDEDWPNVDFDGVGDDMDLGKQSQLFMKHV